MCRILRRLEFNYTGSRPVPEVLGVVAESDDVLRVQLLVHKSEAGPEVEFSSIAIWPVANNRGIAAELALGSRSVRCVLGLAAEMSQAGVASIASLRKLGGKLRVAPEPTLEDLAE